MSTVYYQQPLNIMSLS